MAGFFGNITDMFSPARRTGPQYVELEALRERYDDSRPIYSSRIAVAFDAEDTVLGQRVVLWTFRKAIQPVSEEAAALMGTLRNSFPCQVRMPAVLSYGFDKKGTCFYTTEQPAARPLQQLHERHRSAALYITQMLRIVSRLHDQDIVLGCIGEDSFLVDNEHRVYLNGLFSSRPVQQMAFESTSNSNYLAPEQLRGGMVTPATDVFSAGAYIYKFLSKRDFPSGLSQQQLYEHLRGQLPVICRDGTNQLKWLIPVLEKALQWRPEQRYKNVTEFLDEFYKASPEGNRLQRATALQSLDNAAVEALLSTEARMIVLLLIVLVGGVTARERYLQEENPSPIEGVPELTLTHSSLKGTQNPASTVDATGTNPFSLRQQTPYTPPTGGNAFRAVDEEVGRGNSVSTGGGLGETELVEYNETFTNTKPAVKHSAEPPPPVNSGRKTPARVAKTRWWEDPKSPIVSLLKFGRIDPATERFICLKR